MKPIDLHVHSNKSDGSNAPEELVQLAIEKGLSAFALTDHDTVDGINAALSYAAGLRAEGIPNVPEVIPGIELSTEYHGKDIHLVGLYIDHNSSEFRAQLKHFVDSRFVRIRKMCTNLAEAGIDISYEKLVKAFPDSVLTRAHYAVYLVEHGYSLSKEDAYTLAEERQIRKLAEKYDLCISDGSDYHGVAKPGLELGTGYGKLFVPEDLLEIIKFHIK